jgi:hypothetical protein
MGQESSVWPIAGTDSVSRYPVIGAR